MSMIGDDRRRRVVVMLAVLSLKQRALTRALLSRNSAISGIIVKGVITCCLA